MKKILLFLSAFIPLYFLIVVKILIDIIMQNLSFNFLNTMTIIILSLLIGLGIYGAYISVIHAKTPLTRIKIINKSAITEQYFLGYFSLFVLFALSFELERVSIVFVLIIIFIGIVYIKNDLFYINPFLNILGYNFYEITYIDLDHSETEQTTRFFCKGKLDSTKQVHVAKLSHENFSIIENK